MQKFRNVFIVLLLSILSISAVFSSDVSQTPDGTIAFVDKENGQYRLNIIDPDGKNLRVLKVFGKDEMPPALYWSPDGQKIAYLKNISFLEVIDIKTRTVHKIDSGLIKTPTWAPDSQKIAYTKWYCHPVDETKIKVANIQDVNKIFYYDIFPKSKYVYVNIDGKKWYKEDDFLGIKWSPLKKDESSEIFFTAWLMRRGPGDLIRGIMGILAKINSDGSNFKILAESKENEYFYSITFSHSGDKIAFLRTLLGENKLESYHRVEILDIQSCNIIKSKNIEIEEEYKNYFIENWYRNKLVVIAKGEIRLGESTKTRAMILNLNNLETERLIDLPDDYIGSLRFNPQGELIYPKIVGNEYHIFVGEKSIYSSKEPITNISVYNKP